MTHDFLLDVWAFDRDGTKVHPNKDETGNKRGLFSVNFTNDAKNLEGYTGTSL